MPFIGGLDLGQTNDPTALAGVEQLSLPDGHEYHVRYLKRFALGASYPRIASDVAALWRQPPLAGSLLGVDQTGVGRAVVDWLRLEMAETCLVPVTIVAGHTVSEHDGWHVPKKDLVACLQVLFGNRRIKISKQLDDAALLATELQNFRVKITAAANETFEAWREGQHDDLVLAVAIAVWIGENLSVPHNAFGGTSDENRTLVASAPEGVFCE